MVAGCFYKAGFLFGSRSFFKSGFPFLLAGRTLIIALLETIWCVLCTWLGRQACRGMLESPVNSHNYIPRGNRTTIVPCCEPYHLSTAGMPSLYTEKIWIQKDDNYNNNNNDRHFYSAIYLDNSIPRHIYYYPGFSLAAVYTALQHFKELIPASYPFTSPGLSVANVDQCLVKGHYN